MRLSALFFCTVTVLAVVGTVEAQGRTIEAQVQRYGPAVFAFGFGRGGIFFVASRDSVQNELGLVKGERISIDGHKVGDLVQEYNQEIRKGINREDSSEEERAKRIEHIRLVTEKYIPKLREALTKDQFTRLQQINWQLMGTTALSDPDVIEALTISNEQKDKIDAFNRIFLAKHRALFKSGDGGTEEIKKELETQALTLKKELETKIKEVLTKDQFDKFESLKGKEFDRSLIIR